MVYQASVLYPSENLEFKMDYYLGTHMPLVADKWKSFGLKGWEVVSFNKGPDGSEPKFAVKAILTFESAEHLGKALAAPEAKEIFGDVPNFSNVQPIVLAGDVVGSATL